MIGERLGSLGLYLKLVLGSHTVLDLGRHSGWLLLPTTALRNTELGVAAIQSCHVQTVLTIAFGDADGEDTPVTVFDGDGEVWTSHCSLAHSSLTPSLTHLRQKS